MLKYSDYSILTQMLVIPAITYLALGVCVTQWYASAFFFFFLIHIFIGYLLDARGCWRLREHEWTTESLCHEIDILVEERKNKLPVNSCVTAGSPKCWDTEYLEGWERAISGKGQAYLSKEVASEPQNELMSKPDTYLGKVCSRQMCTSGVFFLGMSWNPPPKD